MKNSEQEMKFNSLIPELSVQDIEKSKAFYIEILQFKIEYERPEGLFMFISKEGNQLMLEQENGHWATADLQYPYGRGVNFEMAVSNIEALYQRILEFGITAFRELKVSRYMSLGESTEQKEFLIQDPDGYLLRFVE